MKQGGLMSESSRVHRSTICEWDGAHFEGRASLIYGLYALYFLAYIINVQSFSCLIDILFISCFIDTFEDVIHRQWNSMATAGN
jgi:hypothetical protein